MPATTILVYDDDLCMCNLVRRAAHASGGDTLLAHDKETFLDALAEPVSVVVMSITVPRFDAFEAVKHLDELEFTAPLLLVAKAGDGMLDLAHRFAADHGLDVMGTMTKPLSFDVLTAMLEYAILGTTQA